MAYPQYFTPRERAFRARLYAVFCKSARVVVACTPWGKEDLNKRLDLPSDKIEIIPLAPATDAYEKPSQKDLDATRVQFSLPTKFIFYPAHTWPHKNHIGLVHAIALLAENGIRVPVILTGGQTLHAETIKQNAKAFGVSDLFSFLGFVSPLQVQVLFQLAWCMVFPSLYEGWGLPVQEAMRAGCPVACADATTLPYVAQGGALLFNPHDPASIANAIEALWCDEALRNEFIENGYRAVSGFSWDRTAREFRDLYRKVASGR